MRRWVWSCAGLMVCSGCQTVDRTAWYGGYGAAETPAVSSVVRSVQGQAAAGGCGPVCDEVRESPFGDSRPLPDMGYATIEGTSPPSTYGEQSIPPATPVNELSAAPEGKTDTNVSPYRRTPEIRLAPPNASSPENGTPVNTPPERYVPVPRGSVTVDGGPPDLGSDQPLVDVVIPPPVRGGAYPSTDAPSQRFNSSSAETLAPSDVRAIETFRQKTPVTVDSGLVPVQQRPATAGSSSAPGGTASTDTKSSPVKKLVVPAIKPLQPAFQPGELAPLPAKPAPAAGNQLIQQPILLPPR